VVPAGLGVLATRTARCPCAATGFNPAAGEQCDDGGETATCDADCTIAYCGDGTSILIRDHRRAAGKNCIRAGSPEYTPKGCGIELWFNPAQVEAQAARV
jgi:hypothetical protein